MLSERFRLWMIAAVVLCPVLAQACATGGGAPPTLSFQQYELTSDTAATKEKSDLRISVDPIRISEIYEYPELFAFTLEEIPRFQGNVAVEQGYPEGPRGLRWLYPFSGPEGINQMLLARVRIENNTDHILRMKNARIYLTVENRNPVEAVQSFGQLLKAAERYEQMEKSKAEREGGIIQLEFPTGLYRAVLQQNSEAYELVSGLGTEILPGYSFEGIVAFPDVPTTSQSARISFFDVTTETNEAGEPVKRTTFHFPLSLREMTMWFDRSANRWREGRPPSAGGG